MLDEHVTPRPSISEIRKQYEDERFFEDNRAAAEYAFALAVRLREAGQTDEARRYAEECIRIAESLPANTLDDVVSTRQSVGGVPLPDHFHDGVVRARLAELLNATGGEDVSAGSRSSVPAQVRRTGKERIR